MARIFTGAQSMTQTIITRVLAAFVGVSLSACFVFILMVLKQTVTPEQPPIHFATATAKAFTQYDNTVVLVTRPIKSTEKIDFLMERNIVCDHKDKKLSYDLSTSPMHVDRDANTAMTKVLTLPILLPVGTNCKLNSTMKWSPVFSMKYEYLDLPPVMFQIEARTVNE